MDILTFQTAWIRACACSKWRPRRHLVVSNDLIVEGLKGGASRLSQLENFVTGITATASVVALNRKAEAKRVSVERASEARKRESLSAAAAAAAAAHRRVREREREEEDHRNKKREKRTRKWRRFIRGTLLVPQ